ncbi:hypothetical protein [Odoribacter laneus]|uniref:Uncharacterized protein n=1 Tax=Odoribacter laneus YIT 12061 TaxID=742817 RepID=H1DHR4_9BACT|nr:hypothetical protein [Odoribacter laneus]EHP47193.1 hypothetical protein HMPREF9449_01800 [Odoribacter laneus YIT 12061]
MKTKFKYINIYQPQLTDKNNIYGIIIQPHNINSNDIEQLMKLHKIHEAGYKTFVKFILHDFSETYGQYKVAVNSADYFFFSTTHSFSKNDSLLFLQKITENHKSKIYICNRLLQCAEIERHTLPPNFINFDIPI